MVIFNSFLYVYQRVDLQNWEFDLPNGYLTYKIMWEMEMWPRIHGVWQFDKLIHQ